MEAVREEVSTEIERGRWVQEATSCWNSWKGSLSSPAPVVDALSRPCLNQSPISPSSSPCHPHPSVCLILSSNASWCIQINTSQAGVWLLGTSLDQAMMKWGIKESSQSQRSWFQDDHLSRGTRLQKVMEALSWTTPVYFFFFFFLSLSTGDIGFVFFSVWRNSMLRLK